MSEKLRAGEQRAPASTATTTRGSAPSSLGLNKGPRIAVIYAAGTITSGKSGYDPINGAIVGSDTLIEYIRQARRDGSVRAHRAARSTAPADRPPRPTRSGAS